jgi:hypothetical protein
MTKIQIKGVIVTLILASSPILANAEGRDDMMTIYPNARNDRQLSELNHMTPVAHARSHQVSRHRVVNRHQKPVRKDHVK